MSWLLDTDVICQPAKRHGDARVIGWLHQERDRCFTSAIVIAQLQRCDQPVNRRSPNGATESYPRSG